MVATVRAVKDNSYYEAEELKQEKSKAGRVDKENYYSEKNESKGVYFGTASKKLGLIFAKPGDLNKIQNGINPNTEQQIYKKSSSDKKFIDLTLSAPKDFSMLAELDQPNKQKYIDIFDKAVEKTLSEVEKKSYRVTNKGVKKVFDTQLLGVRYKHVTARPTDKRPDMQWHSHCLISTIARTKDGEYRRLETYPIFNNQKLYGAIFRAELANGLRELGFQIQPMKEIEDPEAQGVKRAFVNSFKVAGITDEMRSKFSNRANDINRVAEEKGKTSSIDKNNIAQSIKRAKEEWGSFELRKEWHKDAKEVGIRPSTIESWKTFKKPALNNIKLETEIIKESYTSKGKLFESKLLLKLQEQEQFTGIPAKEYYNKMMEQGLIKREKGFELSSIIPHEKYKSYKLAKSYEAFDMFKSQFEKKGQMHQLLEIFCGRSFISLTEAAFFILFDKGDKKEKFKPFIAPSKPKPQKAQKATPMPSSTVHEQEVAGMSIGQLEAEARRSDISLDRMYALMAQIDKLYRDMEQARLRGLNTPAPE